MDDTTVSNLRHKNWSIPIFLDIIIAFCAEPNLIAVRLPIIIHIIIVEAESAAPIKNIMLKAISLGIGSAVPDTEVGTTKIARHLK